MWNCLALKKKSSNSAEFSKQRRAAAVQKRLAGRPAPGRARNQRRLARTILLGGLAVALAIHWLADAYGVGGRDLLQYLWASLGFVALFVGMAACCGLLLGLAKWRHRRGVRRRALAQP